MKKEYAMYSYGINGFSYCFNKETEQMEDNLLIMYYGHDKKFVFPKEKAYNLIVAINGDKNPNGSTFDKENFNFELKYMDIVKLLKTRLQGRAFVMITDYKNPVEYVNGVQNGFVGLTGLDLDCKLLAKTKKELFKDGIANYDVENYCEPPKDYKEEPAFEA